MNATFWRMALVKVNASSRGGQVEHRQRAYLQNWHLPVQGRGGLSTRSSLRAFMITSPPGILPAGGKRLWLPWVDLFAIGGDGLQVEGGDGRLDLPRHRLFTL